MMPPEDPVRAAGERSLHLESAERGDAVSPAPDAFFAACAAGDLGALRALLAGEPGLVHERRDGATGTHLAARHPEVVKLLLEHGADPNARDTGDNALPVHFAAGSGIVESVRALLDAGSDVHGSGDAHRLDVIGWATVFTEVHREVVSLLVARGARHHVFSAVALGDRDLLRRVVKDDPDAVRRRLSPFEQEQTVLHYVVAPADGLVGGLFRTGDHYQTLDLLIAAGAELDAVDAKGRTALDVAMLRADREAMRRLHAAGARVPEPVVVTPERTISELRASSAGLTPMLAVPDVNATVAWYQSIGFDLAGVHQSDGRIDWASLRFGNSEIMFVSSSDAWRQPTSGLSLWIRTDRLDELYALLSQRQLRRAGAELAGEATSSPAVPFTVDLHTAFYGQREFCVRDPNGIELCFCAPVEEASSAQS